MPLPAMRMRRGCVSGFPAGPAFAPRRFALSRQCLAFAGHTVSPVTAFALARDAESAGLHIVSLLTFARDRYPMPASRVQGNRARESLAWPGPSRPFAGAIACRNSPQSAALADLVSILDLEQLERNLFSGSQPPDRLAAGLRRAGDRPRPWSRPAARSRAADRIRCTAISCCRDRPISRINLRSRPHPRRGGAPSPPAGWWRSRTDRPSSRCRPPFQIDEPGFDHAADMPDVPMPEDLAGTGGFAPEVLAKMPETVRRYFERERPSICARSNSSAMTAARTRRVSTSGSRRRSACLTIPPSTTACWPMLPISRCWISLADRPWADRVREAHPRREPRPRLVDPSSLSAPMTGCSTHRTAPMRAARAGSRVARSTPARACSSPPWRRRG